MTLTPIHSPRKPARPPPRSGSLVITSLIALTGVALVAAAGGGAWVLFQERQHATTSARTLVESAAHSIQSAAGPLLAAHDRAPLRNLLLEQASAADLRRCRIVADGRALADALPPPVSVRRGGEELAIAEPIPAGEDRDPRYANLAVTLAGETRLELSRAVNFPRWTGLPGIAGAGGAGVVGISLLAWSMSRIQKGLRGAAAIRGALLAMDRGEKSPAALSVSDKFGAEAGAWNQLVAEREQLRKQVSNEKARESLGARGDVKADLAYACDALWQGMIMVDDRMTIRYANGAAAIFLQAKRDALLGAQINAYIKDDAVRESIRSVASGTVRHRTTLELKRTEADGGGVLRFNIRPVRKDDTSASVVVMIEDITQQRVADEARNSFVAQATHELRTPLTNIRLYVEQAIEVGDTDRGMLVKCLDVINHECRRLERIVGDMLSVSEIEAGSFKLRTGDVRLDTVFEELRADYGPQAAEKKIDLRFELPPKLPAIKGDRDKIVLALHNLIGNAVKYTPEGGRVAVKVALDARLLTVDISDTGIGVSAEETDLIFEKFYRAKDKRVSQITGTGLGLSLAREVVRLHGGDISVRSELNKGSTFTMTVPTLPEAA